MDTVYPNSGSLMLHRFDQDRMVATPPQRAGTPIAPHPWAISRLPHGNGSRKHENSRKSNSKRNWHKLARRFYK